MTPRLYIKLLLDSVDYILWVIHWCSPYLSVLYLLIKTIKILIVFFWNKSYIIRIIVFSRRVIMKLPLSRFVNFWVFLFVRTFIIIFVKYVKPWLMITLIGPIGFLDSYLLLDFTSGRIRFWDCLGRVSNVERPSWPRESGVYLMIQLCSLTLTWLVVLALALILALTLHRYMGTIHYQWWKLWPDWKLVMIYTWPTLLIK